VIKNVDVLDYDPLFSDEELCTLMEEEEELIFLTVIPLNWLRNISVFC
jgi:hypothetical protein